MTEAIRVPIDEQSGERGDPIEHRLERLLADPTVTELTLNEWVEAAERWKIQQTLRQCRGNRSAAARRLGIGRRTLYTKMERLGIDTHRRRSG